MSSFSVIFDLSPPDLLELPAYSNFLSSLTPAPPPILSCRSNSVPSSSQPFVSSTCLQSVLRSFSPLLFPLGVLDQQKNRNISGWMGHDTEKQAPQKKIKSRLANVCSSESASLNKLNIHKCELLDRWIFSTVKEVQLPTFVFLIIFCQYNKFVSLHLPN